ncbi:hypothetical protein ACFE04_017475 [Oxalis oulophora]
MEKKLSSVAKTFTESAIQQLSLLAQSNSNAINLAEGFPDFPSPFHLKNAAVSAIYSDLNQYRHVQGVCDLLAKKMKEMHGLNVHPFNDIVICCGQTEAFAAAVFSIIDPGDEVVLFDPAFETYDACIKLVGGLPVYVDLEPPHWSLNTDKLINAISSRTKAIRHSPHNPTGKVFSKDELQIIASVCCTRDCLAITDEVYEHITFDGEKHISLASLPGMQDRTIITSSLSKTYSVTGWRIGWAIAPSLIASAIRNIHVKLTDSAPAPFQEAALIALASPAEYFESLTTDYELRRDYVVKLLAGFGFGIKFVPQGSFFLFAELPENCLLSDVEYVKELISQAGVVAVPGSGFFHTNVSLEKSSNCGNNYRKRYIRFAFCKSDATLAAARNRLNDHLDASGCLKL